MKGLPMNPVVQIVAMLLQVVMYLGPLALVLAWSLIDSWMNKR